MQNPRPIERDTPAVRNLTAAAATVLDYRAHGCRKFKEHLRDHLANGYVISTPSVFAMFKAVALNDGRVAWYVTYARGDLQSLRSLVPFPLPYIAFRRQRHGREMMRVYPFDRFLRLSPFTFRLSQS